MSSKKSELKEKLLKGYEELLEQLLAEKPADNEIMLADIEKAAIRVGEQAKQQITQVLSEEAKRDKPICPECGKAVPIKDYRSKQVVTEAGEIGSVKSAV
jgi:hypothetical protein